MISIDCQDLTHYFTKKPLFEHIELKISPGIFGIAGANGSGKSTLLKILAGFIKPKHGRVMWRKEAQFIKPEQRRSLMGFAAPYFSFYDELTVVENLNFIADIRGVGSEEVIEWINFFGLTPQINQPFKNLSSGQQQRLRLVSSVFFDPEILFLDEPGSTLDEAGAKSIKRFLDKSKTSKTIILASNMKNELDWCDSVYNIK